MRKRLIGLLIFAIALLVTSCRSESTLTPTGPVPSIITPLSDPYFATQGGGEPRVIGYWLLWNSCASDNRSEVAAANGGRATGWIILDDLLQDPGILIGELTLVHCKDGLRLLEGRPLQGRANPEDLAYPLAAQLLAAQLNLAAAAEYCPAVDDAVRSAQLLLLSSGFDGSGEALGLATPAEDRELAQFLIEQLAVYNAGNLCL